MPSVHAANAGLASSDLHNTPQINSHVRKASAGPAGFRSSGHSTRRRTEIVEPSSRLAVLGNVSAPHLGKPGFRASRFRLRSKLKSSSHSQETAEDNERVMYPSKNGYHLRAASPTFKLLSKTRDIIVEEIHMRIYSKFGNDGGRSFDQLETSIDPENDVMNVNLVEVRNYGQVQYPDDILQGSPVHPDWTEGASVEDAGEITRELILVDPSEEPRHPFVCVNKSRPSSDERTVVRLPDIGLLISPVRVKFRSTLEHAFKIADEARFGSEDCLDIEDIIKNLSSKHEELPKTVPMAKTQTKVDIEVKMPKVEPEGKRTEYFVDIVNQMAKVEDRLRSVPQSRTRSAERNVTNSEEKPTRRLLSPTKFPTKPGQRSRHKKSEKCKKKRRKSSRN